MTAGVHGGGNNEQSIGYDSNGNINALTRTGAQAAGLGYTYSGNRLSTLTKDGTGYSYAYDSNGNTTTDGLRGMTIGYNYLNLPKTVTKGSDVLTYIYDAAGNKLAEKLNSTVNNFYTGAIVYKGDKTIDYIQTSTGIVRKVGADFIRQYNINDHLGNVRAVVNQSGTVDQANDYYPYGLAYSYNNLDKNRYLYNGKELQNQSLATTFFGVYDYGARYYDPVIGIWNSVDPMAEKYDNISPYNYAANNPLRFIDPKGNDIWEINQNGEIANRIRDKTQDAFYMVSKDADGNYQRTYTTDAEGNKTYNSVSFEYGTVESQRSISFSPDGRTTDTYNVYQVIGDDNGTKLFEFMSNNITGSGTGVEVSQAMTGIDGNNGLNFVTTGHMKAIEPGMTHLLNGQLLNGYTIRELNHSHPYTPNPSNNDKGFSSQISNIMKQRNVPVPAFNIYYVPSKQKIPFGK